MFLGGWQVKQIVCVFKVYTKADSNVSMCLSMIVELTKIDCHYHLSSVNVDQKYIYTVWHYHIWWWWWWYADMLIWSYHTMLISMLDACIDASQVVSRNHVHGPRRSFERVPTTEIEYIEILIAILNGFVCLCDSFDHRWTNVMSCYYRLPFNPHMSPILYKQTNPLIID